MGRGGENRSNGGESAILDIMSHDDLAEGVTTFADVVLTLSEDGVIRECVDTDPSTLEYETEELVNSPVTALFATDAAVTNKADCHTATELKVNILESEQTEFTAPIQTGDGAVELLSFITIPRQSNPGMVCFARSKEELPEHTRAPRLIDSIADPLYVVDTDGQLETVNEAMVAYTGYKREELRGRDIEELLPAGHKAKKLLQTNEFENESSSFSRQVEVTIITKDGDRIQTEAHVSSITGEDSDTAGSVGLLRDIRERNRREQNLDLLKKMFSRVFRHNIRNELSVITSRAEILANNHSKEIQTEATDIIASAERIENHSQKARTIQGIVETTQSTEVNLGEELQRTVERAQEDYPAAEITVAEPPFTVYAHPNIGMAFKELIENAIVHATNQATVDIWFDKKEQARTVYVEDESGGLSEHEMTMLQRGDETELEHTSGVGLWLVRWLTEYSDAELIIHRTGSGTLMGIRFPTDETGRQGRATELGQPLTKAPAHVQDTSVERVHDETVIGRVEPRQQLEEIYATVERTGGQTVLITGEAGIGKTTLVRQFREQLSESGEQVVATGVCDEGDQPPYHAFRQMLDDLNDVEEIVQTLNQPVESPVEDAEDVTAKKQAMFADVADGLRTLATMQPVVLVIEDLQWAGQGTVALFKHLVDEVGSWSYPVMFLSTYRTGNIVANTPALEIAEWTSEAGRGTVIELDPLEREAVQSLLVDILEIQDMTESFVESVYNHTGGTPLFVSEIARHLLETFEPETHADLPEHLHEIGIPETVDQTVTERLERVPDSVQPVLETGAVAGGGFRFDLLQEVTELSTEGLVRAIETLVRRQIWTQKAGTIEFSHGVVRNQAVERIDDGDLPEKHRHVAEAIETVKQANIDSHAGQLGYHYEQAGQYETAVSYYRDAGEYAAGTHAYDEAIQYYEQARALLKQADSTDRTQLKQIYISLANIHHSLSEYDAVLGLTDVVDYTTPSQSDCQLVFRQATAEVSQGQYEQAQKTAKQLQELANDCDSGRYLAESIYLLGRVKFHQGDFTMAREQYKKALQRLPEDKDQSRRPQIVNDLGLSLWRLGELEQAKSHFDTALSIARESDDRMLIAATLNNQGIVATEKSEYDRARSIIEESLAITKEIRDKRGTASRLGNLGRIAFKMGRYQRSEQYYEESLTVSREIGNRFSELLNLNNLGDVYRRQGRYDQAREYYEAAEPIAKELDSTGQKIENLRGRGILKQKRGEHTAAVHSLKTALDCAEEIDNPTDVFEVRIALAKLKLDEGETKAARQQIRTARQLAETLDNQHSIALCDEIRGRIEQTDGNTECAAEKWTDAVELFHETGVNNDALRTIKRLVRLHSEQGNTDAIDSWCDRAETLLATAHEEIKARHTDWVVSCPNRAG
ncbi:tetratricopeptide repeat protein [Halovenus rubra]|uniref:Tetratricopeptide repeat protein n=2 Tax=Halovenus rubra TaxID=869890 RepID=A0ACC7DZF5_9EURY|nr:tetratricopeptide repeat protein [Halovenus rubra]